MVQQPAHSLMNRRVADTLIVVEDQVQRMRALIKLINEFSKEQGEVGRKLALQQLQKRRAPPLPQWPQRLLQIAYKQQRRVVILFKAQPGQRIPLSKAVPVPLRQQGGFAKSGGRAHQG